MHNLDDRHFLFVKYLLLRGSIYWLFSSDFLMKLFEAIAAVPWEVSGGAQALDVVGGRI